MEPTQGLASQSLLDCPDAVWFQSTVEKRTRQKVQFPKLLPNHTKKRPALAASQSVFYFHGRRGTSAQIGNKTMNYGFQYRQSQYLNKLYFLLQINIEHFFLTRRDRKSCFQSAFISKVTTWELKHKGTDLGLNSIWSKKQQLPAKKAQQFSGDELNSCRICWGAPHFMGGICLVDIAPVSFSGKHL